MKLRIKVMPQVKTPLTEGRTDCIAVVCADESKHIHDYTAADDPEVLVIGLPRQNDSVLGWRGGTMHGHAPRRMYKIWMAKRFIASNLVATVNDLRMENEVDCHALTYPEVWLARSLLFETTCSTRIAGRIDEGVAVAFGEGYENGDGDCETVDEPRTECVV